MNTHCIVCSDIKRGSSMITDANRIASRLARYVKQSVKISRDSKYAGIVYDVHIPHFMCGSCTQFKKNELTIADKRVHDTMHSLCMNAEAGLLSDREINEILRLIAGYYPKIYRIFERAAKTRKERP